MRQTSPGICLKPWQTLLSGMKQCCLGAKTFSPGQTRDLPSDPRQASAGSCKRHQPFRTSNARSKATQALHPDGIPDLHKRSNHKKRNGLPDIPFQFLLFRLKPSWYRAAPCNKRAAPDFPSARASGWLWPGRHWYRSQNAWHRTKRRSASCRVRPPARPHRPD